MSPWRAIQRTNFTQPAKLAAYLELPPFDNPSNFPLNLPRRLAAKCEKGNLNDPILRQFLPQSHPHSFEEDPVGDQEARQAPQLLRKYAGRALLLPTSACAMHCRYCFRQHFDYGMSDLSQELEIIRKDESLREIILSGGDPLSLSNEKLSKIIDQLVAIPHLKILRIHTRFPIGIPERIDDELLELLRTRLQTTIVIHCNHPKELDADVLEALKRLPKPLLNQSVLLKGVNDDLETLVGLCQRLIEHGILPYYLHQLDRVAGAEDFEVREEEGLKLIEGLRKSLPGYGVPKYVREIAGEPAKTAV